MIVRIRGVTRRTILRGAGISVGLPLLESLAPPRVLAQPAVEKKFLALFFPNGSERWNDWQLGGSGTSYTMGTAHGSLASLRNELVFIKNLNGQFGGSPDHSRGTAEFLTGAPITDPAVARVQTSIDQVMVQALAPKTPLASLHLGPTPYAKPPADTGWTSGYNTAISWSSPSVPNSGITDAQAAFDRVFTRIAPGDGAQASALADKRRRLQQSVLDYVNGHIRQIRPRLDGTDAAKVDEYLTSLRDLESRLQAPATPPPTPACGSAAVRPGAALSFADHTTAMLDLVALAFQCGVTRFITYQMDYGFGNKDFTFLFGPGGSVQHHNITHSNTTYDAKVYQKHAQIVRWYVDRFAALVQKLKATSDGAGVLLDSSLVYFGSDVGDGWSHSHRNLPIILTGRAQGALRLGRLLDGSSRKYPELLLALLQTMNVPQTSFAGASAPLPGL